MDTSSDERYSQSIEVRISISPYESILILFLQLSWEELRFVVEKFGFQFQQEDWREVTYANCKESMMYNTYRAKFFTVTKPVDETTN